MHCMGVHDPIDLMTICVCFCPSRRCFWTCLVRFVQLPWHRSWDSFEHCWRYRQSRRIGKARESFPLCSLSQRGLSSFFRTICFPPAASSYNKRWKNRGIAFFWNCRGVETHYCLCKQLAKFPQSVSSAESDCINHSAFMRTNQVCKMRCARANWVIKAKCLHLGAEVFLSIHYQSNCKSNQAHL